MKTWLLPCKVNLSTQFLNFLKFLYDCKLFTIKTKSFVYFLHLYTRLYENGNKRVQHYRFLPNHAEPLQLSTRSAPSGQNVVLICKTVTVWNFRKEKRYVSEKCPTHTLPSVTFCILQLFLFEAPKHIGHQMYDWSWCSYVSSLKSVKSEGKWLKQRFNYQFPL